MISAAAPLLLLGTVFVAVPIILHLIMRRQPKRLEFPALRFLRKRELSNRRKLKLRHLLLLLLRCGAIALLALALARVRVQSTTLGSAEGPVAAAIVIDTTPRMLYQQDNQTRLEAAQEMATWLLSELPADSDLAVIDSRRVPAGFALDAGSAQNRIDQLQPTNVARPLVESLGEALRLVGESEKQRKEIYVLTDLARWSWPAGSRGQLEQKLSGLAGVSIYLIDVSATGATNFALGELTIPKQVIYRGDVLRVETELHCVGTAGERKVELHLIEGRAALRVGPDGRPQDVDTHLRDSQTISVSAGESQPLKFDVSKNVSPLTLSRQLSLIR
ncbi:MAG: BatA and WFA domain-containing protein [Planctomycetes bacterium]|nr:BatA and WFA domain-containing protein [Planctomycetota bacterium]